jgi:hypothetical protein
MDLNTIDWQVIAFLIVCIGLIVFLAWWGNSKPKSPKEGTPEYCPSPENYHRHKDSEYTERTHGCESGKCLYFHSYKECRCCGRRITIYKSGESEYAP